MVGLHFLTHPSLILRSPSSLPPLPVPTPPLIVESTIRFLKAHLPFSRMARRDLEFIAARARLGYFPVGSTIVDPADGIAGAPAHHPARTRARAQPECRRGRRGAWRRRVLSGRGARGRRGGHAHFRGHRGRVCAAAAARRLRCAARALAGVRAVLHRGAGRRWCSIRSGSCATTSRSARRSSRRCSSRSRRWCGANPCTAPPRHRCARRCERMSEEGVRTIAVVDSAAPAARHLHAARPDGSRRAAGRVARRRRCSR